MSGFENEIAQLERSRLTPVVNPLPDEELCLSCFYFSLMPLEVSTSRNEIYIVYFRYSYFPVPGSLKALVNTPGTFLFLLPRSQTLNTQKPVLETDFYHFNQTWVPKNEG